MISPEIFSHRDAASFFGPGWCASGSAPYHLIDLEKEYHITQVVVMGNREQTKWSDSYSLRYSHSQTLVYRSISVQVIVMICMIV